jgi:hypothetical protein
VCTFDLFFFFLFGALGGNELTTLVSAIRHLALWTLIMMRIV